MQDGCPGTDMLSYHIFPPAQESCRHRQISHGSVMPGVACRTLSSGVKVGRVASQPEGKSPEMSCLNSSPSSGYLLTYSSRSLFHCSSIFAPYTPIHLYIWQPTRHDLTTKATASPTSCMTMLNSGHGGGRATRQHKSNRLALASKKHKLIGNDGCTLTGFSVRNRLPTASHNLTTEQHAKATKPNDHSQCLGKRMIFIIRLRLQEM